MTKFSMDVMTNILRKKYGITAAYYIDKLCVYFDSTVNLEQLKKFKDGHEDNDIYYVSLPHHPQYNKKIELYRPSQEVIELLNTFVLDTRADYIIQYVEFAFDLRTKDKAVLQKLRKFFDQHFAVFSGRTLYEFTKIEGTSYYNIAPKKTVVIYNDVEYRKHPTKLSLHFEYRLKSIEEVKSIGVYEIEHLVKFDHNNFWSEHMTLYKPDYGKLGEYKTEIDSACPSKFKMTKVQNGYSLRWKIVKGKNVWRNVIEILQETLHEQSANCLHKKKCIDRMTTGEAFTRALAEVFG